MGRRASGPIENELTWSSTDCATEGTKERMVQLTRAYHKLQPLAKLMTTLCTLQEPWIVVVVQRSVVGRHGAVLAVAGNCKHLRPRRRENRTLYSSMTPLVDKPASFESPIASLESSNNNVEQNIKLGLSQTLSASQNFPRTRFFLPSSHARGLESSVCQTRV
jgi:hypothetical protein